MHLAARRRHKTAALLDPANQLRRARAQGGVTVATCGTCPNRLVAQISANRTKKYANMTGQSTSRLMSRPRLKVRAAPSMNKTRRSNVCLCSHQRMSKPIQSAISMPAATGPTVRKVQTATPIIPVEMVVFTLSSPSSLSKPRHFG